MENNNYVFTEEKITIVEEQQMSLWTDANIHASNFCTDKISASLPLSRSLQELNKINIEHKFYNVNNTEIYQFEDSKIHSISFFSGAGGLDIGSQLAGVKTISSLDFDRDSVLTMKNNRFFDSCEHNFDNIINTNAIFYNNVLKKNNPEKLILIGGPPCQPFSKAGYWQTHENRLGSDDPRNMIGQYLRMIGEMKPDGFILENVESLMHPTNKIAVDEIKEFLYKLGYSYIVYKANSANFGVPQKRKRVFFIGSKNVILKNEPLKTHGSPEEIILNPQLLPYEPVINWIGKYDVPKYADKDEYSLGKYKADLMEVPLGKNYIALTEKNNYPNPKFVAGKRYWSFLLKLHPMQPSWTIISKPGYYEGPFHWNSRRLRLEEIAAIQTFPEDYKFCGSKNSIHKQIGNAVPPLLGQAIVKFLISQI
jgi:DNA (cytosine-5)-methyltransferase 1